MAKVPPVPAEQRSFAADRDGTDPAARLNSAQPNAERREGVTGPQSSQPGDDDINLSQQGEG